MGSEASGWQVEFDHFEPIDERRREALLALGNGVLSWRASAPEASACRASDACHYPGLYCAGWYDKAPRDVNGTTTELAALARLPDPFGLSISADGQHWFDLHTVEVQRYQQSLHMHDGQLRRRICFVLAGRTWELEELRFVSMANPHLAVLRWVLNLPAGMQQVHLRTILDGSVDNSLIDKNLAYEGRRLKNVHIETSHDGHATLTANLTPAGRRLAMAVHTDVPGEALDWDGVLRHDRLCQETTVAASGEQRLVIEKRVVVLTDQQVSVDSERARKEVLTCLPDQPFDVLRTEHERKWRELWSTMPMRLSNHKLERALRLHAFHLLQAVSPHSLERDQGFPPRGWQEGYYGQVFWDEIFAFPFLVSHFPKLARGLLGYRYRRLDIARERARRAGLRGAMFPWRSGSDGEEETPPFQQNPLSGRWMPDHTHLQWHIGSAIAYDAWQLFLATGDQALLAEEAGELILEVARFWASAVEFDEASERYVIRGVIGPDEYHNLYPGRGRPGLDNNAYTNLMACWTLRLGIQMMANLHDDQAAALRERIGLQPNEPELWSQIADRMYLPLLENGVLSQFDGFSDLLPPSDEWLHDDRPRLDWMLEAEGDQSDRYQLSKQTDVLMLLHLFPSRILLGLVNRLGYRFDEADLRRTAEYHLGHVTHESSLSTVVCAGALTHLDAAASWRYFLETAEVDLAAPSRSGTLEGVHLGAMSGSLDVLQRHYLGIWPEQDGLHVLPAPPLALGDVEQKVWFRGAELSIALSGDVLTVVVEQTHRGPVPIHHPTGKAWLGQGDALMIMVQRSQ